MNAVETPAPDINGVCGSDSDSNLSDDFPEYYQPISTLDNSGGEDNEEGDFSGQDPNHNFHHLPNGLSFLDLSDSDHENDEEETEAATESERAIERAFGEDERRRRAPLTAENAGRVIEAMRQVSFGGGTPHWAAQVPENHWVDRLRRLRGPIFDSSFGFEGTDRLNKN